MTAAEGQFASPPCLLHELDPHYVDPQQRIDVMRWRKAERERLIAERVGMDAADRQERMGRIARHLETAFGPIAGQTISFYWPFRGAPDPRDLMTRVQAAGGRVALPVVVARAQPMVFRAWKTGEPLESGVWNIPIPAASAPEVMPDIVVAPLVGFDRARFRLGYGGGFFDRTLAAMPRRPRIIGVGYDQAAIPTIFPQVHDIPMDMIVTESALTGDPR